MKERVGYTRACTLLMQTTPNTSEGYKGISTRSFRGSNQEDHGKGGVMTMVMAMVMVMVMVIAIWRRMIVTQRKSTGERYEQIEKRVKPTQCAKVYKVSIMWPYSRADDRPIANQKLIPVEGRFRKGK